MIRKSVLVLLAGFLLTGCGKLSRSDAEKILKKEFAERPISVYFEIPSAVGGLSRTQQDIAEKLVSAGHLKYQTVTIMFSPLKVLVPKDEKSSFDYFEGNVYAMKFTKDIRAKVCEQVVDQITGIVQEDKTSAIVEFTWKYDNFQPIYEIVKPALKLEQPAPLKVQMKKYDDGWRLEK